MNIAVSSGHKKSVVLAYDETKQLGGGRRLFVKHDDDNLNLHCLVQGTKDKTTTEMADRLRGILKRFMEAMPPKTQHRGIQQEDRLTLSLPGITSEIDYQIGHDCVPLAGWPTTEPTNYCVVDDTYAGLLGGARSTLEICAFLGTGASVYMGTSDGSVRTFTYGKTYKFDGFGAMLGDHGSGFRMALSTLEHICRCLDVPGYFFDKGTDSNGAGILLDALLQAMRPGSEPKEYNLALFQNWFDRQMANRDPNWRFTIADLAKVITKEAAKGNEFAKNRVEDAAKGLVKTIQSALELDDFYDMASVPIYCQGGMFRNSMFYFERVRKLLRNCNITNPFTLAEYSPCVGALFIACSQTWTVPDEELINRIREGIAFASPSQQSLCINQADPES